MRLKVASVGAVVGPRSDQAENWGRPLGGTDFRLDQTGSGFSNARKEGRWGVAERCLETGLMLGRTGGSVQQGIVRCRISLVADGDQEVERSGRVADAITDDRQTLKSWSSCRLSSYQDEKNAGELVMDCSRTVSTGWSAAGAASHA